MNENGCSPLEVVDEYNCSNVINYFNDELNNPLCGDQLNELQEKQFNSISLLRRLSAFEFTKIANIGNGAYGEVTKQRWIQCDKFVAVKTLCCNSFQQVQSIIKELSLMYVIHTTNFTLISESFSHPHIIQTYGVFEEDNKFNIVMEYAKNGSLLHFLKQCKEKITVELQWNLIKQCTLPVYYLHDKKLLHRDIKSENYLVCDDIMIKISDFGVIKNLTTSTSNNMSIASSLVGTVVYKAPEMYNPESTWSETSDIFSLALVFLEIATQQQAYWAPIAEHIPFLACDGKRPKIPDIVDSKIAELIRVCWDQNPQNRFTAKQILDFVERYA